MNLTRRAGLLILPVLLAGYILAALQAYSFLAKSRHDLEQARLDHHVASLKSTFSGYHSFLHGFLAFTIESERFKRFLTEQDDRYRDLALGQSIRDMVDEYQRNQVDFASLAIFSRSAELLYYFESSDDPFAEMRPEYRSFARQMLAAGEMDSWHLAQAENGSSLYAGTRIDIRTLHSPLAGNMDHSVLLVAAVDLTDFQVLLDKLRAIYPVTISIHHAGTPDMQSVTTPSQQLLSDAEIAIQQHLHLAVDESYLGNINSRLALKLMLVVAGLSLLTYAIVMLLIRRYVTHPIGELDSELERVINGEKNNITPRSGHDEISRLGDKFHDIYERTSQLLDETYTLSRSDSLTSLPNRLSFQETVQKKLVVADRENFGISFMYIDLDNFKFVNDKYGHDVGDQLLRAFVGRLRTLAQKFSRQGWAIELARLSGDEFILSVDRIDGREMSQLAQQILNIFEHGFRFEKGSFPVTVSLGIASFPEDGHTLSQLISNADLAMYEAKRCGRNRYRFYSKLLAETSRRNMDVEDQLRVVDPDREFFLVYMPIVDDQDAIVGAEVLVRWRSQSLGFVGPDEFIPIAESSGLFEKIDFWVIDRACSDYAQLAGIYGDGFRLAINISSAHLATDSILFQIEGELKKTHLPAGAIELEITETFAVEQHNKALDMLGQLQSLGVRIAIDDFGTGYTSMMQMVEYPADTIKLDKSFVDRVTEGSMEELLASLVNLCHLQGMSVTAEGVETSDQKHKLLAAGCDHLQGYLFSKPILLAEFLEFGLPGKRERNSDLAAL